MDNLNSKKFIVALLLIVCATVLVAIGKLDAVSWEIFVGSVGGGYLGVNLGQIYMEKKLPDQPTIPTIS